MRCPFLCPILVPQYIDDRRPKPISCRAGCLQSVARPGQVLDCPAAHRKARLYRELGFSCGVIGAVVIGDLRAGSRPVKRRLAMRSQRSEERETRQETSLWGRFKGDFGLTELQLRAICSRTAAKCCVHSRELGSEFDGPEAGGGTQEFEAYQNRSGLGFRYARNAARQFFLASAGSQSTIRCDGTTSRESESNPPLALTFSVTACSANGSSCERA